MTQRIVARDEHGPIAERPSDSERVQYERAGGDVVKPPTDLADRLDAWAMAYAEESVAVGLHEHEPSWGRQVAMMRARVELRAAAEALFWAVNETSLAAIRKAPPTASNESAALQGGVPINMAIEVPHE